MARDPSEPTGRDRVELSCIFIPDGDQGPLPSSAFGRYTVEFRCIFVSDSHDEPRVGYPWIEFGRLTLNPSPGRPASGVSPAGELSGNDT
jgi:hypothetical protein